MTDTVNGDNKRLSLEQVVRYGGFHDQISAIGQALHTNIPGVIAEDLGKLVFVGAAGGLPAVALAILVLTCRRLSFVVGSDSYQKFTVLDEEIEVYLRITKLPSSASPVIHGSSAPTSVFQPAKTSPVLRIVNFPSVSWLE